MHILPVDIGGLNLLLGGGIPVLKRHDSLEESATLLVRGPPGSGKTLLGVQLAGSLARSLDGDVAYGCVELLPSELEAQYAGTERRDVHERVVKAPFTRREPGEDGYRIFAGLLDLGAPGGEAPRIGDAIGGLLQAIEDAGGRPRVLVVDSLSDGYNLGAKAPRPLADELCKMAARRGMILILLEEAVDGTPNAWSFATDVVLQLSPSEDSRRIVVAKNRFGPAEPGAHRFMILPSFGAKIFPQPRAYLSKWAPSVILPGWTNMIVHPQEWPFPVPEGWPLFKRCMTAVYGPVALDVRKVANWLGFRADGGDVVLDFNSADAEIEPRDMVPGEQYRAGCGNPYLGGDELLDLTLTVVDEIRKTKKSVRRVLVGDLQSVRSFWKPDEIRQALGVLVAILHRVKIPAILFETTPPRANITSRGLAVSSELPLIIDFADVMVEIQHDPVKLAVVSHARSGQQLRVGELV